jgi:hypothetical protein
VPGLTADIPASFKSALEAEAARSGRLWSIRTRRLAAPRLCGRKAGRFESVAVRKTQIANDHREQKAACGGLLRR